MLNRVPAEVKRKLPSNKHMSEAGRGTHIKFVKEDDSMCLMRWLDKRGVILLSTVHSAEPIEERKCWSKPDKGYVEIPRPALIKTSNKMGGMDICDHLLSCFPIRAWTKKWTVRFLFHLVDLAIVSTELQYPEVRSKK